MIDASKLKVAMGESNELKISRKSEQIERLLLRL